MTAILLPNHYRYAVDFNISSITGVRGGGGVAIDSYEEYREAIEARLHCKEFWENITNHKTHFLNKLNSELLNSQRRYV